MSKILVVENSAVDRQVIGALLSRTKNCTVVYAANVTGAMEAIRRDAPDLVVTDLKMPELEGLELVDAVKIHFPSLPIVLITTQGSEGAVGQALAHGAASYVPEQSLASELSDTVSGVLDIAGSPRHRQRLLNDCLVKTEAQFSLPNDLSHLPSLVGQLQENFERMKLGDDNVRMRVAVALREAMTNAIVHGNLEIGSELRESNLEEYYALIARRRLEIPYSRRQVHISATETQDEARYVILDEGAGFDQAMVPDPRDPANLEKPSGRGLLLIHTFMDEVHHNAKGNEIIMIKRRGERRGG